MEGSEICSDSSAITYEQMVRRSSQKRQRKRNKKYENRSNDNFSLIEASQKAEFSKRERFKRMKENYNQETYSMYEELEHLNTQANRMVVLKSRNVLLENLYKNEKKLGDEVIEVSGERADLIEKTAKCKKVNVKIEDVLTANVNKPLMQGYDVVLKTRRGESDEMLEALKEKCNALEDEKRYYSQRSDMLCFVLKGSNYKIKNLQSKVDQMQNLLASQESEFSTMKNRNVADCEIKDRIIMELEMKLKTSQENMRSIQEYNRNKNLMVRFANLEAENKDLLVRNSTLQARADSYYKRIKTLEKELTARSTDSMMDHLTPFNHNDFLEIQKRFKETNLRNQNYIAELQHSLVQLNQSLASLQYQYVQPGATEIPDQMRGVREEEPFTFHIDPPPPPPILPAPIESVSQGFWIPTDGGRPSRFPPSDDRETCYMDVESSVDGTPNSESKSVEEERSVRLSDNPAEISHKLPRSSSAEISLNKRLKKLIDRYIVVKDEPNCMETSEKGNKEHRDFQSLLRKSRTTFVREKKSFNSFLVL